MTRRRDCTCAGTAPGYPQHEDWCGRPERPYEPDDEPVDYLPPVGDAVKVGWSYGPVPSPIKVEHVEDGWVAERTDIPGCMSQGDSREEAVANLADAALDVAAAQAPAVELHSVPTTGGDEQKPSLSDCLKANGVPRQQWATVSAAVAVWMRAWFHDVLDDEPAERQGRTAAQRIIHNPWDVNCSKNIHGEPTALGARCPICRPAVTNDEPNPDGAA